MVKYEKTLNRLKNTRLEVTFRITEETEKNKCLYVNIANEKEKKEIKVKDDSENDGPRRTMKNLPLCRCLHVSLQ